ncbi:hypothetical protein JCGZ_25817 [Jatropha curcas]|uniref:Uncharacterized protein n=1 Tax=Jatropha curcas TaxID=180498 RepID=A0A067JW03_JATCU|nr:hypothetical protein JCGZ_25817 [Jatropha curcas]
MDTLVRSYTRTKLSRRLNGYEPLDGMSKANLGRRTPSKSMMMTSYRVTRAKQRQIFLQSYKLTSRSELRTSRSRKLKKVVVKVKTVLVSFMSFLRVGASRSCISRSAICTSSPTRVTKYC